MVGAKKPIEELQIPVNVTIKSKWEEWSLKSVEILVYPEVVEVYVYSDSPNPAYLFATKPMYHGDFWVFQNEDSEVLAVFKDVEELKEKVVDVLIKYYSH